LGRERGCRCSRWRRWKARRLFDELLRRLLELPEGTVYGVIGALAAIENVFPPIPADTAVALGAFLSHRGSVSAPVVFSVTWAANVGAATGVYIAGRTLGRQFFTGRLGQRLLHPRRLERLERLYERWGAWGVFLSRFLPGVRAVVPPFAGLAGLSAPRAILPMAVASGIWYGVLTLLVATFARELEDVARLVAGLNKLVLLVAVAGVAVAFYVVRRRARLRAQAGGS
jgi:membrane protein DedA with SNARE-associated domain